MKTIIWTGKSINWHIRNATTPYFGSIFVFLTCPHWQAATIVRRMGFDVFGFRLVVTHTENSPILWKTSVSPPDGWTGCYWTENVNAQYCAGVSIRSSQERTYLIKILYWEMTIFLRWTLSMGLLLVDCVMWLATAGCLAFSAYIELYASNLLVRVYIVLAKSTGSSTFITSTRRLLEPPTKT